MSRFSMTIRGGQGLANVTRVTGRGGAGGSYGAGLNHSMAQANAAVWRDFQVGAMVNELMRAPLSVPQEIASAVARKLEKVEHAVSMESMDSLLCLQFLTGQTVTLRLQRHRADWRERLHNQLLLLA